MDGKSSETLEMSALGRPFSLGMLYDARADKLVPGITLWDSEKLQDMTKTLKPNSEFDIVASESISDKSSSLGVDAALKASFFSGLVTVDGSAKYLKDTKTSKHQARVTLKYKTTTHFRKLNQLGRDNIKYPKVFEQGLATHVVTAILYGAQAFFVFDREVSDSENLQDIQGNLQVMIKKIPSISIEGEGALKIEDKDKERVNNFSCRFHGDFNLSQNPVTFEDAVKVYQDLPKLLGPDGEKAVPVSVWLLPLTSLDSAAARLVRQISVRLVFEVERTLEHLDDLEMRCRDVMRRPELQPFPQIVTKIKTFMCFCSEFKLGLQGVLVQKLPSIRGGGEEEAELAEILKKRAASAFSRDCLDQWISCKTKEINLIKTFTNLMKHTEILSSQSDLDERSHTVKNAVCFVFTALESEEPYLSALDQFLKGVGADKPSPRPKDLEKEQWYSHKDLQEAVKIKAKLFADFAEVNKDNEDVKFFTVAFTDENHKGSTIYLYEDGFEVSDNFEPPSKPENISVKTVTHNSVTLCFSAPSWGAEAVTGYRLEVRQSEEWQQQSEDKAGPITVTGLSPDTEYDFRVRAVTEVGLGPAAELKNIKTAPEPEGPRRLAEELRKTCDVIETKGSLQILKVPLKKDEINISGCAKFIFGRDSVKRNCTIMVMGATGAGKSTLIDGMINYILGVQWTDPFRFKLVVEVKKSQAESQTSEVTVYKLNFDDRFMIDFSLTIIDTPGFGDTRGIDRDREITEQIRNLFSNNFGVSDIHTVCFVAQSALARLSATQRYVFDSVLSIFGHDVAENIRVLVTFADGQEPPVLEAIKEAKVPCPKDNEGKPAHYKFNNSALFAENKSSVVGFDEMFWNMGKASMRSFFDALKKTEPKSLTLTKEVLRERKQLEVTLEDLQRKIKEGLAKQDEIKQTEEQVKTHEAEIERNKDFEVKVKVIKPVQDDISGTGKYITNCSVCHYTCHYPCDIGDDADKRECAAMGPDGNCFECKGKCHWSKHYNQKYRWEYKEVTETTTVEELKKKYLQRTKDKKNVEGLVSKLKQMYQELKNKVSKLVEEAVKMVNRLGEIALKPNPLSTPDYIQMMIEAEKKQHGPGWKQRVKALEEEKEKAELLTRVGSVGEILAKP